jgi:hypothetical protein
MTPQDMTVMLESQHYRCAICDSDLRKPYIDHSKRTGRVRAILCCRCNNWLAAIECPGFADKARQYVEWHNAHERHPTFRVNEAHFAVYDARAEARQAMRKA